MLCWCCYHTANSFRSIILPSRGVSAHLLLFMSSFYSRFMRHSLLLFYLAFLQIMIISSFSSSAHTHTHITHTHHLRHHFIMCTLTQDANTLIQRHSPNPKINSANLSVSKYSKPTCANSTCTKKHLTQMQMNHANSRAPRQSHAHQITPPCHLRRWK